MKLSQHSKMRMRERTNLNHKERQTLFRNALRLGQSIQDVKDERIKKFLISKQKYCKVKLYQNYVFIYGARSKKLYTMYKLPQYLWKEREMIKSDV